MRSKDDDNNWAAKALNILVAEDNRTAETNLYQLDLPALIGIDLYIKDESAHPTGSLKHRLARALFHHGICSHNIDATTTIVESSSGSTAISEAYFARLLGLKFIAVVPQATAEAKIKAIEGYGGQVVVVKDREVSMSAAKLAHEINGYYMDQFTHAERVSDWRHKKNIAAAIFDQMLMEEHPEPSWIITGAGTGGTSAIIGRYLRFTQRSTRLCVVDPDNSIYFDFYKTRQKGIESPSDSLIEGIGRPRVEASFMPEVIDHMIQVKDAHSLAAMRVLNERFGLKAGASTGTNLYGALQLANDMMSRAEKGSIVTLLCDLGSRYDSTYYSDTWLAKRGFQIDREINRVKHFLNTGVWPDVSMKVDEYVACKKMEYLMRQR